MQNNPGLLPTASDADFLSGNPSMPSATIFPGDCPIPQNRLPTTDADTMPALPLFLPVHNTILPLAIFFSYSPESCDRLPKAADTLLQPESIPARLPVFWRCHPAGECQTFPDITSIYPNGTFPAPPLQEKGNILPNVRFASGRAKSTTP